MGEISPHSPVLLVLAAFSRHESALSWVPSHAEKQWGQIVLKSDLFEFCETTYYAKSMGTDLRKQFFAFANAIDPSSLPAVKQLTNQWEDNYRNTAQHGEQRPLNLDPGYLTLGKLVLASTKDHAHRIYLSDGIYAETTLYYQGRQWCPRPWTFPDYRRPDYQRFFDQCRRYLKNNFR